MEPFPEEEPCCQGTVRQVGQNVHPPARFQEGVGTPGIRGHQTDRGGEVHVERGGVHAWQISIAVGDYLGGEVATAGVKLRHFVCAKVKAGELFRKKPFARYNNMTKAIEFLYVTQSMLSTAAKQSTLTDHGAAQALPAGASIGATPALVLTEVLF